MRKIALCPIIISFACGLVIAQTPAAQGLTSGQDTPQGLQTENAGFVRMAVVNSQRAFEMSTEGQKLLAKGNKLSKAKKEEEIQRIRTEMIDVIERIAKEKGFSVVMDLSSSGIVCHFSPVEDITDDLIKRYNALIR